MHLLKRNFEAQKQHFYDQGAQKSDNALIKTQTDL